MGLKGSRAFLVFNVSARSVFLEGSFDLHSAAVAQTHAQGRMMGKICYKNNGLGMEDLDQECSIWTIGTSILCRMTARS